MGTTGVAATRVPGLIRRGLPIALLTLLAVALLAPGTAGAGKGTRIKLGDNFFKPKSKQVKKGAKVRFAWTGKNRHNVTLRKGPGNFASKTTGKKGVNFTRRFKKRGTYKIYCTIHPKPMKLNLKVG